MLNLDVNQTKLVLLDELENIYTYVTVSNYQHGTRIHNSCMHNVNTKRCKQRG